MKSLKIFFLSCLFLFTFGVGSITVIFAQNQDSLSVNDEPIHFGLDFFDQEKPLEIELAFNIKELTSNKNSEEFLPAIITIIDDSVKISKPVKIRARGNVRKEICYFPPYVLNFKKSDITDDLPSDIDKIKVVSHCVKSNDYTNYIFKEYLAYKIYTILTDKSFKVRLARITYTDTGRKNKSYTEWAFLVEPEEVMAERLNALPIKLDNMSHTYLDTISSTVMVMFQYMIGNTDFALTGRHNLKLIKSKDHTKTALIPVPYDLDYSGFVNAHYAIPKDGLLIKSVTERYYNGICRSDEVYKEVFKLFFEKKDSIFSYINTFELLDKKNKKYVNYYIEEFYKELSKPGFIKDRIRPTCF
jgi:hypothetical protein